MWARSWTRRWRSLRKRGRCRRSSGFDAGERSRSPARRSGRRSPASGARRARERSRRAILGSPPAAAEAYRALARLLCVRRAEHAKVRRRLVRKELALPFALCERALEHEHLPVAVGSCFAGERRAQAGETQAVSITDQVHDSFVELLRLRREPVRPFRVVTVPVIAARDERDALWRCGRGTPD